MNGRHPTVSFSLPPLSRGAAALGIAAVVCALFPLFWPTGALLVRAWWLDPNYSHGFVIPLVSAWLAWRYLRTHPLPAQGETAYGCTVLLGGGVVHLAALVSWPLLDFLALVLILRGLAILLGGRAWASGLTFPILFLFFMFPLPASWTGAMAVWLQDLVAGLSAGLLDLVVIVHRRGNTLQVAGVPTPLEVAAACSGLRQMVAFVALGAFLAYLFRKPFLFGLLLTLAAIPVAILANVVRVVLMALGMRWFGSDWVSTWLHDAPALVTLPLGLALFGLIGLWLNRFWPTLSKEAPACV